MLPSQLVTMLQSNKSTNKYLGVLLRREGHRVAHGQLLPQQLVRHVRAQRVKDEPRPPRVPVRELRHVQDGAVHKHPALAVKHLGAKETGEGKHTDTYVLASNAESLVFGFYRGVLACDGAAICGVA